MKTHLLFLAIGFFICTAFIPPTEDYRDAYVGTYFCRSKCQSLTSDYTEINYHNDTVTISITKNTRDSILNITIQGRAYEVKVNNAIMNVDAQVNRYKGKFFSQDSISFSTSSGRIPNGCSYRGKKQ